MRLDMTRCDKMAVTQSLLKTRMFLSGMREKTDICPKTLRKEAVETIQKVYCAPLHTQVQWHTSRRNEKECCLHLKFSSTCWPTFHSGPSVPIYGKEIRDYKAGSYVREFPLSSSKNADIFKNINV